MIYLEQDKEGTGRVIEKTVGVLKAGGIVAYPTETFYGLGVRFDNSDSLKRLYGLKRRPREKAMPLIIGGMELLSEVVPLKWLEDMPSAARVMMDRYWPGPLTLLLPAKEGLPTYLTGNTGKVAVRIPGESFALDLARGAGFPITATSANLSGLPPAGEPAEVMKYFDENIDLIVDAGAAPGGLPSTIVDLSGDGLKVVREGAISLTLNRQ